MEEQRKKVERMEKTQTERNEKGKYRKRKTVIEIRKQWNRREVEEWKHGSKTVERIEETDTEYRE